MELIIPFKQNRNIINTTKNIVVVFLTALLLFVLVRLNYPIYSSPAISLSSNPAPDKIIPSNQPGQDIKLENCDIFTGEWIPNPDAPYYTNTSCYAIHDHQDCMKHGRPDSEFMRWRWKPEGCDLPVFNPFQFLDIVRDKSLAFVGDSVARNQMQSLICLLSRVEYPIVTPATTDDYLKRWKYESYNFTMAFFWSPFLVRSDEHEPNDDKRTFKLYLDEFDEHWPNQIGVFDYVIISAGHWFFRPTYFYLDRRLSSCLYCPDSNVTHQTTAQFSYRRAFRTALRAINGAGFGGVAFLRTFAPSHYEGGAWDNGGDCPRRRPYGRNDVVLEGLSLEMYGIQVEELGIAEEEGKNKGGRFRLFDVTRAMMMRPDGHPSKYGHMQGTNQSFPNDCVHWCLPGPIDSWNDFLQELLTREYL